MHIKISENASFTKIPKKFCSKFVSQLSNEPILSIQEAKSLCAKNDRCIGLQGVSVNSGNFECLQSNVGCELCTKIKESSNEDRFVLQKGKQHCKQLLISIIKIMQFL